MKTQKQPQKVMKGGMNKMEETNEFIARACFDLRNLFLRDQAEGLKLIKNNGLEAKERLAHMINNGDSSNLKGALEQLSLLESARFLKGPKMKSGEKYIVVNAKDRGASNIEEYTNKGFMKLIEQFEGNYILDAFGMDRYIDQTYKAF